MLQRWVDRTKAINAAVLYGSRARALTKLGGPDAFSDYDLHIITSEPDAIFESQWKCVFAGIGYCFHVRKPAVGGVEKISVISTSGDIELVVIPVKVLRHLRSALKRGLSEMNAEQSAQTRILATGVRSGYRFLKGSKEWAEFYALVAKLPGLRLNDQEIVQLATTVLSQIPQLIRRIKRGELMAAQHQLHRVLADANFTFARELRLRRGGVLPSYELARHAERLFSGSEVAWIRVDARLTRAELRKAVTRSFDGMQSLLYELMPSWRLPAGYKELLTVV